MTVCNMSIEAGARAGMIAPDETTFAYLKGRRFAPGRASCTSVASALGASMASESVIALADIRTAQPLMRDAWSERGRTLANACVTDEGAIFDREMTIDAASRWRRA